MPASCPPGQPGSAARQAVPRDVAPDGVGVRPGERRLRVANRAQVQGAIRAEHASHRGPLGLARRGAGRQQGGRVRMVRPGEHRIRRPGLDDLAAIHHRHPVGHVAHHVQIVGDEQ